MSVPPWLDLDFKKIKINTSLFNSCCFLFSILKPKAECHNDDPAIQGLQKELQVASPLCLVLIPDG